MRIECFGTGTLEWSSSSGLDIPSDSQNQKYQQPDYSRGVQTLYINDFSDSVTSTYTCTTDLTNDHLRKTVYITNCKFGNFGTAHITAFEKIGECNSSIIMLLMPTLRLFILAHGL